MYPTMGTPLLLENRIISRCIALVRQDAFRHGQTSVIGMKEFFIVWHDVICRCRLFIAVTCFDVSASISSCSFRRWTPLISINSHQHSLESCYYLLLRDGFQRQQNDRNIKGRSPRSSMEPMAVAGVVLLLHSSDYDP